MGVRYAFLVIRAKLSDPKSYKVGMWMAEHFSEQIGLVGRSSMIEIGIAEDVVDMYIEKAQRELKDPRLQLSVKLYDHFICVI